MANRASGRDESPVNYPGAEPEDIERTRAVRLVLTGTVYGKQRSVDKWAQRLMLISNLGPGWRGEVNGRDVERVDK